MLLLLFLVVTLPEEALCHFNIGTDFVSLIAFFFFTSNLRTIRINIYCCTIFCRQETGIGRTVNSVRKHDGEVGNLARKLISKWKDTVSAEETESVYKEDPDEFSKNNSNIMKYPKCI